MKIGITGAHSTGKTTLLNALRSEPAFESYAICDEVTRQVLALGVPINENGNDITQRLIMNQHIVNLALHENMLTDRTALDGLVYTEWLLNNNKIEEKTFHYAQKVYNAIWLNYDVIFYTPIEFNVVGDGVRSVDPKFRNDIGSLFEKHLENNPHPNIVTISGSVYKRLEQVFYTLEDFNERRVVLHP
jgi:dephospho-CoA kinase